MAEPHPAVLGTSPAAAPAAAPFEDREGDARFNAPRYSSLVALN